MHFGHFALGFVGFFATNAAFAQLVFQHWVIGGASAPKLIASENMAEINNNKRDKKEAENNAENIQEFHVDRFE